MRKGIVVAAIGLVAQLVCGQTFLDVVGGDYSFGGSAISNAVFVRCAAGNYSFGSSTSGVVLDNVFVSDSAAGSYSFGYSSSGTSGVVIADSEFVLATAADYSFGANQGGPVTLSSSVFRYCLAAESAFGNASNAVSITDSVFLLSTAGRYSFGVLEGDTGGEIMLSGRFEYCSAGDRSFGVGGSTGVVVTNTVTNEITAAVETVVVTNYPAVDVVFAGEFTAVTAGNESFGWHNSYSDLPALACYDFGAVVFRNCRAGAASFGRLFTESESFSYVGTGYDFFSSPVAGSGHNFKALDFSHYAGTGMRARAVDGSVLFLDLTAAGLVLPPCWRPPFVLELDPRYLEFVSVVGNPLRLHVLDRNNSPLGITREPWDIQLRGRHDTGLEVVAILPAEQQHLPRPDNNPHDVLLLGGGYYIRDPRTTGGVEPESGGILARYSQSEVGGVVLDYWDVFIPWDGLTVRLGDHRMTWSESDDSWVLLELFDWDSFIISGGDVELHTDSGTRVTALPDTEYRLDHGTHVFRVGMRFAAPDEVFVYSGFDLPSTSSQYYYSKRIYDIVVNEAALSIAAHKHHATNVEFIGWRPDWSGIDPDAAELLTVFNTTDGDAAGDGTFDSPVLWDVTIPFRYDRAGRANVVVTPGAALVLTSAGGVLSGTNTAALVSDGVTVFDVAITSSNASTSRFYRVSITRDPQRYRLYYNRNGGTAGLSPLDTYLYSNGEVATVAANAAVVRTAHRFTGWNTAADGSAAAYSAGDDITITADTTLYAQWQPVYTIIYSANAATSGSPPVDSNSYDEGETATVLPNSGELARDGFSFAGWNTAADGSGTTYSGGDELVVGSSDILLYAKWEP